jgi:vancomycin resistance protein VanJ
LRIDYMFSTARVTPLHLDTDCTPRGSDHCVLLGRFAVH